jgi:hypothetical protein
VQPRTCSRPERGNVPRLAPGAQDAWRLFVYAASLTRPFWSLAASTDGVVSAGTRNVPCPRAVVSPLAFVRPRNLFTPARPPRQGRGRGSCSLQAGGPTVYRPRAQSSLRPVHVHWSPPRYRRPPHHPPLIRPRPEALSSHDHSQPVNHARRRSQGRRGNAVSGARNPCPGRTGVYQITLGSLVHRCCASQRRW